MPRRNSDKRNENLRRVNRDGIDAAELMRKLRRETRTTSVGRAMQDARRRAASDA